MITLLAIRKQALAALALVGLVGCAAPGPVLPPDLDPRPEIDAPGPRDESGLDREIRELRSRGEFGAAEMLLREQLTAEGAEVAPGSVRLMLGETLEMAGQSERAAVEYALVPESVSRAEQAAAWSGQARLRSEAGDERGAVRASLRVWELSDDREAHTSDVLRALRSLPVDDLRRLESETRGLDAHSLVTRLLRQRVENTGPGELTVTLLVPATGRFEQYGAAFRLGAELALAHRNAVRPGGRPVRVVVRDTQGDIGLAGREARLAVADDAATAILGPLLSAPALAAGNVAQAYRIPLIAPTATDPAVREVGPFVIALDSTPRELVRPLVEFAVHTLSLRRFGALVPSDGVSGEFEREFRRAVEHAGGSLVLSLVYETEQRDFRKLLDRFTEAGVDGVYMPGSGTTLEQLAPQLDFYEFDRRVLGHGGWMSPRVLDPGNLALEGALFSAPLAEQPDSEFTRHLRQQVWDVDRQEVSRFHVRGWQAMEACLAAVDGGATDGEALVEVLTRREFWADRPVSESVELLTYRDGALGPASWSRGFDLVPKKPAPKEEEAAPSDPADIDG